MEEASDDCQLLLTPLPSPLLQKEWQSNVAERGGGGQCRCAGDENDVPLLPLPDCCQEEGRGARRRQTLLRKFKYRGCSPSSICLTTVERMATSHGTWKFCLSGDRRVTTRCTRRGQGEYKLRQRLCQRGTWNGETEAAP